MNGIVELHFVPSEKQLADIFTEPLDESTFTILVSELGIPSLTMLNMDKKLKEESNMVGRIENLE